jgi:hypothetical protein
MRESVCQERICVSSLILYAEVRLERKNLKSLAYIHIGAAIHIERGRDWKENERQTDKKRKETGLDLSVKTLLSLTVVSCSNPPAGFPI